MTDEERIAARFYGKEPFEDKHGLRGPAPEVQGIRQILGTTGDRGAYNTDEPRPATQPQVLPQSTGTSSTGTTVTLTVILNGSPKSYNFLTQ